MAKKPEFPAGSDRGSQSGFTLIEVMISAFATGILAAAVAGIFPLIIGYYHQHIQSLKTDIEIQNTLYSLKLFLGQALDIRYSRNGVDSHPGVAGADGAEGWMTRVQPENLNGTAGVPNTVTIARFFYENGSGILGDPNQHGKIEKVGIFYTEAQQPPGLTRSPKAGMLWIANHAEGSAEIRPERQGLFFSRIVGIEIPESGMKGVDPESPNPRVMQGENGMLLTSAEIRVTFRYFLLGGRGAESLYWCADDAECGFQVGRHSPYKDVTRSIVVAFRNNRLHVNRAAASFANERLYGRLYFFRFSNPRMF